MKLFAISIILLVLVVFSLGFFFLNSFIKELEFLLKDFSSLEKRLANLELESGYQATQASVAYLANKIKSLEKLSVNLKGKDEEIESLKNELNEIVFSGLSSGITSASNFQVNTYDWSPNSPSTPTTTIQAVNSLVSTGIGIGTSTYWTLALGTTTSTYSEGNSLLTVYGTTTVQTPINSLQAFRIFNAASSSIFQVDTLNSRIGISTSSPREGISLVGSILLSPSATGTIVLNSANSLTGGCIEFKSAQATSSFHTYATTTGPLSVYAGGCR
ncbi:MAG: hypothetical protein AABY22_20510 [Nanoarchaeota archaeon]